MIKQLIKHTICLSLLIFTLTVLTVCASASNYSYNMDCTVNYVDESGNNLKAPYVFTTNASNPSVNVKSPSFSGYRLRDSCDAVVTYDMMSKYFPPSNYVRHGTATYTVVYVKVYGVTVNYKYQDGTAAASSYKGYYANGETYTVYSPGVYGYTPSHTYVSGTLRASEINHTVTYYRKTYTVAYDANGGSGAPASQIKTEGVTLTLSAQIPQKDGSTFSGWALTDTAADHDGRIHFVPVYVIDGSYTVSVTAYQLWTPAGMISATRNCNIITINGTIYDDYYIGSR